MRVDPSTGGSASAARRSLLADAGIEQVAPLRIDEWATMAASRSVASVERSGAHSIASCSQRRRWRGGRAGNGYA